MADEYINTAPRVYPRGSGFSASTPPSGTSTVGNIDRTDVFEAIRDIRDPEHPHSLEELRVVCEDDCLVVDSLPPPCVTVVMTPTVPHCSLAATIGLAIRVKLERDLPSNYKVFVVVKPGSHSTAADITKQVNDKERVSAAMENPQLAALVNQCAFALPRD